MMTKNGIPGLTHVDHVGLTVPDLEAAIRFYEDIIGAVYLYKIGPFDARELPKASDGRDWTEAHINVEDARLTIAMLQVGSNVMLELFQYDRPADRRMAPPRNCDIGGHHIAFKVQDLDQAATYLRAQGVRVLDGPVALTDGPCAGLKINYFLDPWGNQLELVEYTKQQFEESAPASIYRP